ncbi:pectin acetylesterase [Trifolium medium]|uniref:Pectin acetylesterase n=1 Tax=Trifolium medium TaxID=97028 RepID=A0A392P121_9FABA|nr:pectin acetylesterase [Trifolium medium]
MESSSSQPENVIIPWSCLQDHASKTPVVPTPSTVAKKSFAEAVNNVCDIPASQFPLSVVKGDRIAISIPENEYQTGLTTCKHNLHGRVIWPKGTTPLKVGDLKAKLSPLWKSLGRWGITSLGKGFYGFYFSSLKDVQSVRSVASWNLSPGILKLFSWSKDFNSTAQQHSTAQAHPFVLINLPANLNSIVNLAISCVF